MRNLAPLFRIIGPVFLALLPAAVSGQPNFTYTTPYAISTLAGTTSSGHEDGVNPRFFQPSDVAVDAAGNLYIADTGNHAIRKRAPNGTVSTLAGLATVPGDADGLGSAGRFSAPSGIAIDASGNLYVADLNTHLIRKISPAGAVTTLAGTSLSRGSADGVGAAARFSNPSAVAVDSSGNVYVTDRGNYTIRKITPTGTVTTIAGSPGQYGSTDGTGANARFYSTNGIAVDAAGNLYVADVGGASIRKISPAGDVTTFARVNNPSGLALDAAGNLLVSCGNGTVSKISSAGVVTALAGDPNAMGDRDGVGSAARFTILDGIAVDAGGNAFVADVNNNTIRMITPGGTVSTLAGVSFQNSLGYVDATGADARFGSLTDLAVDAAGNVYAADPANHCVRKVSPAGVVTTLAGSAATVGSADGTGSAASFGKPTGIAIDTAGNLYVADVDKHVIRKITPAGVVTTLAGSPGQAGLADGAGAAARFNGPTGLDVDATGNVFVTDGGNTAVRKITPAGVVSTLLAFPLGFNGFILYQAPNLALDPSGNIFICDAITNSIREILPGGALGLIAGSGQVNGFNDGTGTDALFTYPTGIATDGAGNVYVVDSAIGLVRRMSPARVVTTLAGYWYNGSRTDGAGQGAGFDSPYGITADAAGTIYVTDAGSIRKGRPATAPVITTQPQNTAVSAGGSAQFSVAASGAPDPSYQWYFNGSVFSGGTGSSLSIANARSSDAGDYTVVVTNSLGTVTSAKATLSVSGSSGSSSGGGSGGGGGGGGGAPSTGFLVALLLVVTARAIKGRAMGPGRG